jgi:predicted ATP-binding protein involved in virulence
MSFAMSCVAGFWPPWLLTAPRQSLTSTSAGVSLTGPWGTYPLESLSDGYRSTVQWLLDFMAWSILANRPPGPSGVGGILIVDELEQHLNPRWQREILGRIHQQLPGTQVFVSTHTPLLASGVAQVPGASIVRVDLDESRRTRSVSMPGTALAGMRADQVLVDVFGLVTTRSAGVAALMSRYETLASIPESARSGAEQAEFLRLRQQAHTGSSEGESAMKREAERAVSVALERAIVEGSRELKAEAREQLRELFNDL